MRIYGLDLAALNGGNGILHRAVAERYSAQGFGTAADRILGQIDRARQALGGDIDRRAAADKLLHHFFQADRDAARAVALDDDLFIAGQEGDDGRVQIGDQLEQHEIRVHGVDNISITVEGRTLNVSGADGMVLEVVSLTGRKVATVKIEAPSQRVELNVPKGCYILKVGTVVRKVSVR